MWLQVGWEATVKDEWTERLMYGRGRVQGKSMSACRFPPWSHVLQALEQRRRRGAATKRKRCQGPHATELFSNSTCT